MIDIILPYVKPELIVISVVLYFIGLGCKKSSAIKDKYIPLALGGIGIILCLLWVFATSELSGYQSVLIAIFTSIVQGILVAGLSTYVDQLAKQAKKLE